VSCDSRIFDHDPVWVRDCSDDCNSPTYLCNYACLAVSIEANNLTAGDACEWRPDESDCC
jgi:hypothetical protein